MTTTATGEDDKGSGGDEPDIPMEDNPSESDSGKKESKEESAESASTGSSEGKSGSGGGYSADCSASDQSSDENGDRKDRSSNLNLNVGGLNIHDRAASRSSNSSDEAERPEPSEDGEPVVEDNTDANEQEKVNEQTETSSLGIELPLKSPDTIDLESIIRAKTEEDRENAAVLQDQRVLPQWNGVRIAHPMDPRIDLSTVTVLQAGIVPGAFQPISEFYQTDDTLKQTDDNAPPFSVENYSQLMEVIRPFFQSHGVAWQHVNNEIDMQRRNESGSEQIDSSEGFTSFFTTTHSGTNSGGTTNSGSPQSSDLDKKPRAANAAGKTEKESDAGDASSMVVLARVKRKHKKAEDSGNSATSSDKRVRIQERREEEQARNDADAEYEADNNGGSSGSSSLTNVPNQEQQAQQPAAPLHISVPPRIVTDVSSSKMSSATSSNPNTSSGSGSGGNTGSGSNQGSSGSGNEGKGSSEEPAQEDNSGESPIDESDQAYKNKAQVASQGVENDIKHEANRESRLLDKKRKRIEMRREYEAQQQMESSESSDPTVAMVRPGRPVTMDQVLRFSKIPRIVMQASPPFLIVHTNAAFARLTGIDSHQAVGHPISSFVFLPEGSHQHQQGQQQPATEDGSNPQGSDMSSTDRLRVPSKTFELERLIAACGYGKIQILKVVSRNHQMVGRSVTITKDAALSDQQDGSTGKDEPGKHDSSLASSRKVGFRKTCRASIAPIVSVSAYMPKTSLTFEKEAEQPKQKRRKSHSHESEQPPPANSPNVKEHKSRPSSPSKDHKKHPSRLLVTHYIIQLEDVNLKPAKDMSMDSISSNSTSVEARLVGLSKEALKQQKLATTGASEENQGGDTPDPADDEGVGSESSAAVPEHVSAMG